MLLTSSGVPSLDYLVGGGLQVGSLVLLHQDQTTSYGHLLLQYFMAQSVVAEHGLLLVSADRPPLSLLDQLMAPASGYRATSSRATTEIAEMQQPDPAVSRQPGRIRAAPVGDRGSDDAMKIAWRYQGLPQVSSSLGGSANPNTASFCTTFDITKKWSKAHLDSIKQNTAIVDPLEICATNTTNTLEAARLRFNSLLARIQQIIDAGGYS